VLSDKNKIYDTINKINATPFTINRTLLNFIQIHGYKFNLLIDNFAKHEYSELEKPTKYQKAKLKGHNTKLLLQDSILSIAEFYSKFP
jgi:hypothetical protein